MSNSENDNDGGFKTFALEPLIITTNDSSADAVEGVESILNQRTVIALKKIEQIGLTQWMIGALHLVTILVMHDGGSFWVVLGSVLNTILSFVLKRILNQERATESLTSDHGMPSSYVQSLTFIIIYSALSVCERYGENVLTGLFKILVGLLGSCLSWLRVTQRLHTLSQTAVGAFLGWSFSILWYWLWSAWVLEAFDSILWVRATVIVGGTGSLLWFAAYAALYWVR